MLTNDWIDNHARDWRRGISVECRLQAAATKGGTPNYSYLKHSIGTRRAAFRAGHTPKISTIATLTVNPVITAQRGIEEGRLGIMNPISLLMPMAASTPITPPRKVNVIASNKN